MSKRYALALIVLGLTLYLPSKPPGEFGLPLHVQAGVLCLVIGVIWIGALIFIGL